jgi:EAL domain-containing protein (putative c-di-GMP-specific phosphodiesterase class I)
MEALIRWNDPEAGEVPPDEFIPWPRSWASSCRSANGSSAPRAGSCKRWSRRVSRHDGVDQHLAAPVHVAQARLHAPRDREETGADPSRIELEITETMIMRNLEQSIETLAELRAAGMQVAVDDFGVGYSSLNQLTRLPASSMKIDRSFINNVVGVRGRHHHRGDHRNGQAPEAARDRRGVENRAQLDFLRPTTARRSRATSSRADHRAGSHRDAARAEHRARSTTCDGYRLGISSPPS